MCDAVQRTIAPEFDDKAVRDLDRISADAEYLHQRYAHPAHRSTAQPHYLRHAPEALAGNGPPAEQWIFPAERQMGDTKRSIMSHRAPEANLFEIQRRAFVLGHCLRASDTAADIYPKFRAIWQEKPVGVIISTGPDAVRLHGEQSRTRGRLPLSDAEKVGVWELLIREDPRVRALHARWKSAFPQGGAPPFDAWLGMNLPGVSNSDAVVLAAGKPTTARRFSHAEIRGHSFRGARWDDSHDSFDKGVKHSFQFEGRLLEAHGEAQVFLLLDFAGVQYAMVHVNWFEPSDVGRHSKLGLPSVKLGPDGAVPVWKEAARYSCVRAQSIVGQFFIGDMVQEAAAGGGVVVRCMGSAPASFHS